MSHGLLIGLVREGKRGPNIPNWSKLFLLNITIQVGKGPLGEGACEPACNGRHLWRKTKEQCLQMELHDRAGQGLEK